MDGTRQGAARLLRALAVAVLLVLVIPLALLWALALYVRALVGLVVSIWARREAHSPPAVQGPHFLETTRMPAAGEAGQSRIAEPARESQS